MLNYVMAHFGELIQKADRFINEVVNEYIPEILRRASEELSETEKNDTSAKIVEMIDALNTRLYREDGGLILEEPEDARKLAVIGTAVLRYATAAGSIDVINALLRIKPIIENISINEIRSLLQDPKISQKIVEKKSEFLNHAIVAGRVDVIDALLSFEPIMQDISIDDIQHIVEDPVIVQKMVDTETTFLTHAIAAGRVDIMNVLLDIEPIMQMAISRADNLLFEAADHDDVSVLNTLLDDQRLNQHFLPHFLPSFNEVLPGGAFGDLATTPNFLLGASIAWKRFDVFNRLLEFDMVVQYIVDNPHNVIYLANLYEQQNVIDRLMEIPAVRESILASDNENADLWLIAQNSENSIQSLNSHELGIVNTLKARYASIVENSEEKEKSLRELQSYLEGLCQKENVSLLFEENDPKGPLLNVAHQAWRYLFAQPNPWMSVDARFVKTIENGKCSDIIDSDWLLLALVWKLLNDNTAKLNKDNQSFIENNGAQEDEVRESLRKTFVETLALAGREHNYDLNTTEDDGDYDMPCCRLGVKNRVLEGVLGFQMAEKPQTRPFSAKHLAERLKEQLIVGDNSGLKSRLMEMSLDDLSVLKDAFNKILFAETDFNSEEMDKLQLMNLSDYVDTFIQTSKEFYSPLRWMALVGFTYQGSRYNNCEEFIRAIAEKPWEPFFNELNFFVDQAIESKKLNTKKEPLIFSETALPTLGKRERNKSDYESDSEMSTPKAFKRH